MELTVRKGRRKLLRREKLEEYGRVLGQEREYL
jgi:hypothetical protein